jgi:hypothetical protein
MTRICPHCQNEIRPARRARRGWTAEDAREATRLYRQRLIDRLGIDEYNRRNAAQVARWRAKKKEAAEV